MATIAAILATITLIPRISADHKEKEREFGHQGYFAVPSIFLWLWVPPYSLRMSSRPLCVGEPWEVQQHHWILVGFVVCTLVKTRLMYFHRFAYYIDICIIAPSAIITYAVLSAWTHALTSRRGEALRAAHPRFDGQDVVATMPIALLRRSITP